MQIFLLPPPPPLLQTIFCHPNPKLLSARLISRNDGHIGSDREEAVEDDDDEEEGEPSRRQFDGDEDEVTGKLRKEK